MKRLHDEAKALSSLRKKNSITIDIVNKVINISKDATDVGNSSWGKIDYLCKVCGYSYIYINRKISKNDNKEHEINKKIAKRDAKLNMANMAKNAMKKVRIK